jgi:hypothetical protein
MMMIIVIRIVDLMDDCMIIVNDVDCNNDDDDVDSAVCTLFYDLSRNEKRGE